MIEAEQEGGHLHRDYPMFLDAFGTPILYWRADPAGRKMLDYDPGQLASPTERGIYHWIDNGPLVYEVSDSEQRPIASDGQGGAGHRLECTTIATDPNNVAVGTFQYYILHEQTRAKAAPQRADSYLLVTPGADGRYGTADDVTNFEHRGS